ncbi:hypothetical protein [Nonlabens ulvanivorans]|uniref:hypothetical protein n=1 Tax=Nonlabens ulvanivorans TaxID=906888 RepID=UPI002943346D|nr:hypothetical protein [Nonlabens ulvanivorans]WOI23040.1 hypothetical protein R1T42_01070 [Nonlabens ulvanivorans]
MKKLLFIIAVSVAGLGYAQTPQITDAQLENSRVISEKNNKLNAIVDQKVDQIMTLGNVDAKRRGELLELVHEKETQTLSVKRENLSDIAKQSKINDIRDSFETKLKAFLGEEKYAMVKNAISPK